MNHFDFVFIAAIALGAATVAILNAPEGYEDETGFHFDDSWLSS